MYEKQHCIERRGNVRLRVSADSYLAHGTHVPRLGPNRKPKYSPTEFYLYEDVEAVPAGMFVTSFQVCVFKVGSCTVV